MMKIGRRNLAFVLVLVLLVATFVIYAPTLRSMASLWFGSSSFLYGVLILPMSAYLVWRKRFLWLQQPVRPALAGVMMLLMSVLAWTIASLVSVQVLSQLAFIAMLGTATWSVLGTRTVHVLMFPLLYAFLAVPMGAFLIPTLMDWTASGTVRALQITGIPVLREGNYFSLPSGNFEVIAACSGIRFLLVTVVLGLYFAHETYKTWFKRAVFLLFAAISIIVANWVRAYLVVLGAHLTDMRFGTGQSHIYMGMVIFLVVITGLFWIGRHFEDMQEAEATPVGSSASNATGKERSGRRGVIITFVFAVGILVSGPALLDTGLERMSGVLPRPSLPVGNEDWIGPGPVSLGFRPAFVGASDVVSGQYSDGLQPIELHIVFYSEQQQGDELVGWQSRPFDPNEWRSTRRGKTSIRQVPNSDEGLSAQSLLITNDRQLLRLWYWYDIGGVLTSRPSLVKSRQAWNAIVGNRDGDAVIVLVTPVADSETGTETAGLESFVRENLGVIRKCLRPSSGDEGSCESPDWEPVR